MKVININLDEDHAILDKCPVLKEYAQFVDVLRRHQADGNPDPFKSAIEECIQAGILSDYLKKKGSEVRNMLVAEYDYDMDIEVQREEAFEEGMNKGRSEGRLAGKAEGLLEGKAELVKKKLSKGLSVEEIADVLEESTEAINEIIKLYQIQITPED